MGACSHFLALTGLSKSYIYEVLLETDAFQYGIG